MNYRIKVPARIFNDIQCDEEIDSSAIKCYTIFHIDPLKNEETYRRNRTKHKTLLRTISKHLKNFHKDVTLARIFVYHFYPFVFIDDDRPIFEFSSLQNMSFLIDLFNRLIFIHFLSETNP
jgi:hypothetical protein